MLKKNTERTNEEKETQPPRSVGHHLGDLIYKSKINKLQVGKRRNPHLDRHTVQSKYSKPKIKMNPQKL